MKRFTKEQILNAAIYFLTALQLLFAYNPPPVSEEVIKLISAIILFLVPGLTAWRQTISLDVSNKIKKFTWLIVAIGFAGGVTDLTNLIPITNVWGRWLRFTLTGATTLLNAMSKQLLPSEYYKFKQQQEQVSNNFITIKNKTNEP